MKSHCLTGACQCAITPLGTLVVLFLFICRVGGCNQAPTPPPPGSVRMQIGTGSFILEVAANEPARRQGLMNRDSMPPDHGMLFVFPEELPLSFWMKNTRIPLDILYIDASGYIVSIKKMKPHDLTSIPSDAPAKYAIELNAGTATRVNIKVGNQIVLPQSLPEAKD
jgi:uncharacterized protein